jgi:putative transposase
MPNHVHMIMFLSNEETAYEKEVARAHEVGAHSCAPLQDKQLPQNKRIPLRKPRSLGTFISGFKATTTRCVNDLRKTPGARLWQRNYYEHIIRNEEDLNNIRKYIQENPARWEMDKENPKNL